MSDVRRYDNYKVTYFETYFLIENRILIKPSIYYYRDVSRAYVGFSDQIIGSGLRIVTVSFLIYLGLVLASKNSFIGGILFFSGISLLFAWPKKKRVPNASLRFNNGYSISFVMTEKAINAFCYDVNDRITRFKQRKTSPDKIDAVSSRPENEGQGNNQEKGSGYFDNHILNSLKTPESWFCPDCGTMNSQFVPICICGRSKETAQAIAEENTESKSDNKANGSSEITKSVDTTKKWRCSKCKAINDGRIMKCMCGAFRFEPDPEQTQAETAKTKVSTQALTEENTEPKPESKTDVLGSGGPWFCPGCGRTNGQFVTICICGRRQDGTNALTEVKKKPEPEPAPSESAKSYVYAAVHKYAEDGAVKLKLSYSSETVRIKIDQVVIKDLNDGISGISFSGEQKYGKPVDAILCYVKLLDSFDEILSQKRMSFFMADNSGDGFVTDYEEIDLDEQGHRRVRKADIEVLKIAFV